MVRFYMQRHATDLRNFDRKNFAIPPPSLSRLNYKQGWFPVQTYKIMLFSGQVPLLTQLLIFFFIVHYRVAAKVYFFKVNNRTIRKRCEITSKLIKTPERRHLMAVGEGVGKIFISKLHKWRRSGVFIVNVIHLFLVFFFFVFEQVNVSWGNTLQETLKILPFQ